MMKKTAFPVLLVILAAFICYQFSLPAIKAKLLLYAILNNRCHAPYSFTDGTRMMNIMSDGYAEHINYSIFSKRGLTGNTPATIAKIAAIFHVTRDWDRCGDFFKAHLSLGKTKNSEENLEGRIYGYKNFDTFRFGLLRADSQRWDGVTFTLSRTGLFWDLTRVDFP